VSNCGIIDQSHTFNQFAITDKHFITAKQGCFYHEDNFHLNVSTFNGAMNLNFLYPKYLMKKARPK